jgi:hypothetical protein
VLLAEFESRLTAEIESAKMAANPGTVSLSAMLAEVLREGLGHGAIGLGSPKLLKVLNKAV